MLYEVLKRGEWCCLANAEQVDQLQGINDIDALVRQFESLPITLKDNHRSTVKRGSLFGKDIVAKRPIDKNKRLWARVLSVGMVAEAAKTIDSMGKFHRAGIESVKPLFALEKRKFGMVVDSWLCYEYRGGEPCGLQELNAVAQFLRSMHRAGFRHDDPSLDNFLVDDGGLFTIDCKGRSRTGAFSDTYDFVLLKRTNKITDLDINTLGHFDRRSIGYWLAMLYTAYKAGRSALKGKLKKNRPKNT